MAKYNKYKIGDILGHVEARKLEFQVVDVLPSVPEKKCNYLYLCKMISGRNYQIGSECRYHENDLVFIRKATFEELESLLQILSDQKRGKPEEFYSPKFVKAVMEELAKKKK